MAGPYRCSHCSRTFKMPAHLARHQSSHEAKKPAAKTGKGVGRSSGRGAGINLSAVSLEDLSRIIQAARDEASRRIAELQKAMG